MVFRDPLLLPAVQPLSQPRHRHQRYPQVKIRRKFRPPPLLRLSTADLRDHRIADLCAVLQRAVPLLAFAAGREADTDPRKSALLSAAADDPTNILDRTAP